MKRFIDRSAWVYFFGPPCISLFRRLHVFAVASGEEHIYPTLCSAELP